MQKIGKISVILLCCLTIILTGCKIFDENITPEDYIARADGRFAELESDFSTFSLDQMPSLSSQTEISFSFPDSNLSGNGIITIDKESYKTDEKSDIDAYITRKWEDFLPSEAPKSFQTQIQTRFIDQKMYALINQMELFMGSGNIDAHFFNLMIKDALDKRIRLSSEKTTPVIIVETPRYGELIHTIGLIFSSENVDNLKTENIKSVISLLSSLLNLWIDMTDFQLDSTADNTLVADQQQRRETLYFQSGKDKIIREVTVNKDSLTLEMVIQDSTDEELLLYPSIKIQLTPRKNHQYDISGEMRLLHDSPQQPPERSFEWKIGLKPQHDELKINFNALIHITTLELAKWEKLNIMIQGTQQLKKSDLEAEGFTAPTEFIDLWTTTEV